MSKSYEYIRGRTRSTVLTSLFIIALVMFVLGLFASMSVYSYVELEKAQEEIEMMLELPEFAKDEDVDALEEFLLEQPWVKELKYTSKEEAGEFFLEEVGEEFLDLMGETNPLPASFDISLNIAYINSDSLAMVNEVLTTQEIQSIKDIIYPIAQIEQLRENTFDRMKLAGAIGLLVALIAFFIVNGTIRLAIYAKRLVIRSMQLIGASNGFIRRPFIRMGVVQGLTGALIACVLLLGILLLLMNVEVNLYTKSETIKELVFRFEFMVLLGGIVIFGTLLGWCSSIFAVNRFLNKNLDQLI